MPTVRRLWLMLPLVAVAACRCDGGPATGTCTGTWGGVQLADVGVDLESRFLIIYPATCAGTSTRIYDLGYGGAQVKVTFQPSTYPSILTGELVKTVPADFTAFGTEPVVAGVSGTAKLKLEGIYGRRTGSISLTSDAGTDSLDCTFNLPYQTEGMRPRCSSGGGGFDFD